MNRSSDDRAELLVLRALGLGDLLVAVPALRALRRAFPGHRLVLATAGWLAPVVDLVGGVDALLPTSGLAAPLAVPPGRTEVAVNLHGRGPQSHALLDALAPRRRIGFAASGWDGPEWVAGGLERARWCGMLSAYGIPADPDELALDRPVVRSGHPGAVVVHVGAGYGSRAWPMDRFASVASGLAGDGRQVVVSGGTGDMERAVRTAALAGLAPDVVLAGRQRLGEFAALVAEAALVVSADTGAAHLATAYRTPSVVIFGPAPPEEWAPPPGGPHVLLTDPSVRRGDVFAADPDPALLAVTAADVLVAAGQLLAS